MMEPFNPSKMLFFVLILATLFMFVRIVMSYPG